MEKFIDNVKGFAKEALPIYVIGLICGFLMCYFGGYSFN